MIALYVIVGLILLCALLLFLPASAVLNYDDEFTYYVRVLGIKIKPRKDKKQKSVEEEKPTKKKNRVKEYFGRFGVSEALKRGVTFLKRALGRVSFALRHCSVRDLRLKITVAGNDAALTAIEYGTVCSVMYPFLRYLYSVLDIKAKQVDIISDFETGESDISFHARLNIAPFWLLVAAYGIYKEYRILTEEKANERK